MAELNNKIAALDGKQAQLTETKSRLQWLTRWSPESMSPIPNSPKTLLPPKRIEPSLNSSSSEQLETLVASLDDDEAVEILNLAISKNKNDAAILQTALHWMDDPSDRRKKYLNEIEQTATRLIGLLQSSINDQPNEKFRCALDFTRYRRARALVYRELPDVIAVRPIPNQAELDRHIQKAFADLFQGSNTEKTEFILLKIRMHRRAKEFGQALALLEKYGRTILPKWYQKKRRDLLKEMGWTHPYREAAEIYKEHFPAEVEKEKRLKSK